MSWVEKSPIQEIGRGLQALGDVPVLSASYLKQGHCCSQVSWVGVVSSRAFKILFYFLFIVCLGVLCVCMFMYHMACLVPEEDRRGCQIAQNLELQIVVSHYVGAKNRTRAFWKSVKCF